MKRVVFAVLAVVSSAGITTGALASSPPGQPMQVVRTQSFSYDPATVGQRFVDPVPPATAPFGKITPKDVDLELFDGRVVHFVARDAQLNHTSGIDYITWSGAELNESGDLMGYAAILLTYVPGGFEINGSSVQASGYNRAFQIESAGVGRYTLKQLGPVTPTTASAAAAPPVTVATTTSVAPTIVSTTTTAVDKLSSTTST
ncbi:MAG: hypothetical protein Q8K63_09690, partial [Acidimicrobiales bacterium]|nr:hypothetical protein [Acidimicrobiales bacterium]